MKTIAEVGCSRHFPLHAFGPAGGCGSPSTGAPLVSIAAAKSQLRRPLPRTDRQRTRTRSQIAKPAHRNVSGPRRETPEPDRKTTTGRRASAAIPDTMRRLGRTAARRRGLHCEGTPRYSRNKNCNLSKGLHGHSILLICITPAPTALAQLRAATLVKEPASED